MLSALFRAQEPSLAPFPPVLFDEIRMAQTLLIIPSFPAPLFQSNDSKRVTTETKPSMSIRRDPLDLLKKEHEEGQKHLERLGSAADSIKINGFSVEAFEEIVDAVRWMNTDVRRHTDRSEE